jgi:alpha-mannosidase
MLPKKTLHLIGNAHIDPVWLWRWQEGYHETYATFRSALDRMKEYPEFIFTAGSAALYAWIEEGDPQMFAEIQQRVAEGRWAIVGGWWIEPDCNLPCGESFVRQGLFGQRYFKQKFGKIARVAYNIDSFGHNAMLPQIFQKSGLDFYVFLRPMPHEMDLPGRVFRWQSPDGSQVLAFRIPFTYCTSPGDLQEHAQRCVVEIKDPVHQGMCFYGVGNHGGGPTKTSIESLLALKAQAAEVEYTFSHPERFFSRLAGEGDVLPVVRDELQHHASGCYAAHSGIKRWNRLAENRLLAAEKWSAVAAWQNAVPYPREFEHAWKNVLFNQFHDILAGTSLEIAYEDARDSYGEALSIASRALNRALHSFLWNIKVEPQPGVKPLVVFNPLAYDVKAPVEMEFDRLGPGTELLDDLGQSVPCQAADLPTTPWRQRLCFLADLPALGYRTYQVKEPVPGRVFGVSVPGDQAVSQPGLPHALDDSPFVFGNQRFAVQFNLLTGTIDHLYDRKAGCEVFAGPAPQAAVIADLSDTWSHGVFAYPDRVGLFELDELHLVEQGPVRSVVHYKGKYRSSSMIIEYHIYHALEWLGVRVTVNWQEQNKVLKLRFPVNLEAARTTYEIPYGTLERTADGQEEPLQSWLDVSGVVPGSSRAYGFSLLNDGKYSADVLGNEIGLTILRSPAYAHHDPAVLQPGGHYSFIDQGIQQFQLILLPHTGDWYAAGSLRLAGLLNQPPVALLGTFQPQGNLPKTASFIWVTAGSILVTVLKQAEDSQDLVLRACETAGKYTQGIVRFPHWGRIIEADFSPYEIKTFCIPQDPDLAVREISLLEFEEL